MISDDDPTPLDAAESESPAALVRALRALASEQPSRAAMQATEQRLVARLDAQLPAPVAAASGLTGKLFAGRLALAVLAIATAVGALMLRQTEQPASRASQEQPATPLSTPPALSPATPASVPRAAPSEAARAEVPAAPHAVDAPSATNPHPRALAPLPPREHSRKSRPSASALRDVPAEQAALGLAHAPVPSSPSPPPATGESIEPGQQAERPVAPRTELELLLAARKQVQADPFAALSTLAEHARRFPAGQLAPEREVLAIEALRALGRDAQAEQRLMRFRERYPSSVHTPGLASPRR